MTSFSNRFCDSAADANTPEDMVPITIMLMSRRVTRDPSSKEMRRENMDDGRDHQQKEQGKMKNVPKSEQTVIKPKRRGLPDGNDI